jgi:hypothetical protein
VNNENRWSLIAVGWKAQGRVRPPRLEASALNEVKVMGVLRPIVRRNLGERMDLAAVSRR